MVQSTSFVDIGLTNYTTYWYHVSLWDKGDSGGGIYSVALESFSAVEVSTVPWETPPSAPINFYPTLVGVSSITWSWNDVSDESGYRIKTDTDGVVANLPADTTYWVESGLLANTSYYRVVVAINSAGESPLSEPATTYTLANPPTATYISNVGTTSVVLNWSNNNNPDYTKWGILRSTDNFLSSIPLKGYADNYTDTSYTDNSADINPATAYYYKIQAFNEDGVATAFDITISTKTKSDDIIPPKPPVGVKGTVSNGGLKNISWSAVEKNSDGTNCSDLSNYRIYCSNSLEGPWIFVKGVPSTTLSADITITANYYKITAVDIHNNESADSIYIDNSASLSAVSKEDGKIVASVKIPQEVSSVLYKDGQYKDDIEIKLIGLPKADEKDIFVYEFQPQKAATGEKIGDLKFAQKNVEVTFFFDTNDDGYIEGVGLPTADAKQWLSIFYYNGVEWEKLGGVVNDQQKYITVKVSHLSKYKLRKSLRTVGFGDLRMYPKKIFAPFDPNDTFNRMRFAFENDADNWVSLKIFDMKGRLVHQDSTTGTEIYWNGKDKNDDIVSGGVYIYQLECDKKVINGTVVVAK